jgi:low affinity Fe/Cu permease
MIQASSQFPAPPSAGTGTLCRPGGAAGPPPWFLGFPPGRLGATRIALRAHMRVIDEFFDRIAGLAARVTGSAWAFLAAAGVILLWIVTGPLFRFSDTWQLVINTGTTIVTFLMVFLIQHAQNKDSRVVHMKLNELIAATKGASNRLIDVEELTEYEIERLYRRFAKLSIDAKKLGIGEAMSVEQELDEEAKEQPTEK